LARTPSSASCANFSGTLGASEELEVAFRRLEDPAVVEEPDALDASTPVEGAPTATPDATAGADVGVLVESVSTLSASATALVPEDFFGVKKPDGYPRGEGRTPPLVWSSADCLPRVENSCTGESDPGAAPDSRLLSLAEAEDGLANVWLA
jgi:hypothetical protein